jgi:hypothetical protein
MAMVAVTKIFRRIKWAVLILPLLGSHTVSHAQPEYVHFWSSVDGGAGCRTSGNLQLRFSVGQPETGEQLTGGDFEIVGGFLLAFDNSLLFADGFETGDTSNWASASN